MTENEFTQSIIERIAKEIDEAIEQRQKPQGRRVGWRMTAQQYDLQTDKREVRPGSTPRLAHENQPAAYRDIMDNELARCGFDLSGETTYTLAQADEMLTRKYRDDVTLRVAAKQRLSALRLLRDDTGRPGRVPDPRELQARGTRQGDIHAAVDTGPQDHKGTLIRDASGKPAVLRGTWW